MIAPTLTVLWVLGAIGVFAAVSPSFRYRLPVARWSIVVAGSALWPVVAMLAVVVAFAWLITDDGRDDLEDA